MQASVCGTAKLLWHNDRVCAPLSSWPCSGLGQEQLCGPISEGTPDDQQAWGINLGAEAISCLYVLLLDWLKQGRTLQKLRKSCSPTRCCTACCMACSFRAPSCRMKYLYSRDCAPNLQVHCKSRPCDGNEQIKWTVPPVCEYTANEGHGAAMHSSSRTSHRSLQTRAATRASGCQSCALRDLLCSGKMSAPGMKVWLHICPADHPHSLRQGLVQDQGIVHLLPFGTGRLPRSFP